METIVKVANVLLLADDSVIKEGDFVEVSWGSPAEVCRGKVQEIIRDKNQNNRSYIRLDMSKNYDARVETIYLQSIKGIEQINKKEENI